jgi:hypothetical protein
MDMGWEKLFKNNPTPANDSRALAIRYEPGEEAPSANSGPVITSLGALASGDQGRNGEAKSLKVARTFDSIGRRNEGLRTHLDGIELSFRNIETIRSQFYEALGPIDQTLIEIERTKVAHLETERKFEGLSEAHERLRADHAVLTLDRNALGVRHQEASERLKDVEKALATAETSASEARAALTERKAKLERTSESSRTTNGVCIQSANNCRPFGRSSAPRRSAFKRSSSSGPPCRTKMLSWRRRTKRCAQGAKSSWPVARSSIGK